jgi:D-alanyl-lipoteichoic acid acyltransferase DltB (MBOAT superfamily)
MLFNSLQFAIFFPAVTLGFYLLPPRVRWIWLLLASVYFYCCFIPIYFLILVWTILVDYVAGILIERAQGKQRRFWLVASIVSNVGVLAFFKYANFALSNVASVTHATIEPLHIILPIGLSFHTFQSMAYTIEVYRGKQPAERNLGIFALYVLFYPQLVAGPIERPQNLLPQFHATQAFDYDRVKSGLELMAWGMVKKIVVADRLAVTVNQVYGRPGSYAEPVAALATFLFAFQIYCDFSGYSDIALGSAQVMGIKLMTNFDRPYFSRSIAEFWRRWHISLSTWFRDYLYIPLGGSRGTLRRTCLNLLIVFTISGLWHGASWTFVIWGFLHGSYLIASILTRKARERAAGWVGLNRAPTLANALSVTVVFCLVGITWVFFRASNLSEAIFILRRVTFGVLQVRHPGVFLRAILDVPGLRFAVPMQLAAVGCLIGVELLDRRWGGLRALLARQPAWRRWPVYCAAILVLLIFSETSTPTSFIYFQF